MKSFSKSLFYLSVSTLVSISTPSASAVSTCSAQEIQNDSFKFWRHFEVGTSVKFKSTTKVNGKAFGETKSIQKMLAKNEQAIKIQITSYANKMGKDVKTSSIKFTHRRDTNSSLTDPATSPLLDAVEKKTGEETLKIGDISYPCKWYSVAATFRGTRRLTKIWTCEKVPGGVVKTYVKNSPTIETISVLDSVKLSTR